MRQRVICQRAAIRLRARPARRSGAGNSGQSVVSVINTATNSIVQSIPVGISCVCVNPDSVLINRDGTRVYVANEVANTVSVIDTATNIVVGTINVGAS